MMTPEKTAELVQKTLEGDRSAFVELVKEHRGVVFAIARQHTRYGSQIEDAAQEAFLRAYRDLRKLRRPALFGKWLYGVALNVAREQARAVKPSVPLESIPEPAAEKTDPGEEQKKERLVAMVADLPDKYRVPLTMHYAGKLKYEEIGQSLGIVVSTARSLVHRARAMLRERLEKETGGRE